MMMMMMVIDNDDDDGDCDDDEDDDDDDDIDDDDDDDDNDDDDDDGDDDSIMVFDALWSNNPCSLHCNVTPVSWWPGQSHAPDCSLHCSISPANHTRWNALAHITGGDKRSACSVRQSVRSRRARPPETAPLVSREEDGVVLACALDLDGAGSHEAVDVNGPCLAPPPHPSQRLALACPRQLRLRNHGMDKK